MALHPAGNYLSLCSGVGGLDLGIRIAEPALRCLAYVEREITSAGVLVARMEEGWLDPAPIWSDLKTFVGKPYAGRVAGVVGGYPCQPFALSGKRLGKSDPRHLWPHVARIVHESQPDWCFFENVPGHISLGLQDVCADLESMGYVVAAGLFAAAEIGATQERKRLFILGHTARSLCRLPDVAAERGSHPQAPPVAQPHQNGEPGRSGGTLPCFPPSDTDHAAWKAAPAHLEPAVSGVADGAADWVDRMRACGNGVVPLAVAYALRTLQDSLRSSVTPPQL